MNSFVWARWLRSMFRNKDSKHPRKRKDGRSLFLEPLEVRLAPATFTWTGNGANANFSNPANWQGNVAPTGTALDDLSFPGNGKQLTVNNDLPTAIGAPSAVFNSITFSTSGYKLTGKPIVLGDTGTSGSGSVIMSSLAANSTDSITLNLQLNGTPGSRQFFNVISTNDTLSISGRISGSTGSELAKRGLGTLVLSGNNSAFTGPITVDPNGNGGILQVSNPNALGDTSSGTIVGPLGQLQVVGNINVNEALTLNGTGPKNDGALLNVSGNNTWSGNVTLDTDSFIGANAGTLTIGDRVAGTGSIGDTGAGHSVTKVGTGTVAFALANTYRGSTTINNGILQIQTGQSLGLGDMTAATGTTVNSNIVAQGTLQLFDPTGVGFTVNDERLVLNGAGFGGIGALDSLSGNNVWTRTLPLPLPLNTPLVVLGSPAPNGSAVSIGVEDPGTGEVSPTLTIGSTVTGSNSVVSGSQQLTKIGAGTLVFTTSNSYSGGTFVNAGTLEIEDSKALGAAGTPGPFLNNANFVAPNATLELAVDNIPDSVTGTTNTLNVPNNIDIAGFGVNTTPGNPVIPGVGALYSASGINIYSGTVGMSGGLNGAGVGVAPDPNPTAGPAYFTSDYSLTIPGGFAGQTTLFKLGAGQLILPNGSAKYFGNVDIHEGWITIRNSQGLGAVVVGAGQNTQPTITVRVGAALHILPLAPNVPVRMQQNFVLSGVGITHPYSELNGEGAIVSLAGVNYIDGNVQFDGPAGIGSQLIQSATTPPFNLAFPAGQLYFTGHVSNNNTPLQVGGTGTNTGNQTETDLPVVPVGTTSATMVITANMAQRPDDLRVYLGGDKNTGLLVYDSSQLPYPANTPTSNFHATVTIVYTATQATVTVQTNLVAPFGTGWNTNLVSGAATYTFAAPLASDNVQIVMNQVDPILGGNTDGSTFWKVNATITPTVLGGSFIKLGSQLASFEGDGTYTGGGEVREGVLLDQNSSGLGIGGTVTVDSGASLVLASATAYNNGGNGPLSPTRAYTGFESRGVNLVLNGPGNNTLMIPGATGPVAGPALAPLVASTGNNITNGTGGTVFDDNAATNDFEWRGNVTLGSNVAIDVQSQGRLNINGTVDDALNASPSGSSLVKVGDGELMLSGSNSYRGTTYLGTNLTGTDPDVGGVKVNEFFANGGAAKALDGGAVTAANSQALGVSSGSVIVQLGSALQLSGNISVAGKSLQIQGKGVDPAKFTPGTPSWFQQGPLPVTQGGTGGNSVNQNVSGRMTGIAVDPSDPLTIYVTTAGGGAWKTQDGGQTWVPLFDSPVAEFAGAIAIAPTNPHIIYLGTGEADNSGDSFYGTGVWESTDAGHSWTQLGGAANPLYGDAVSSLVVDWFNPNKVYAAVSDQATNSPNPANGSAGVWRWDGTVWLNLTNAAATGGFVDTVRSTPPQNPPASGFPKTGVSTPGPDDDFRMSFPTDGVYSSLSLQKNVLYYNLGGPSGSTVGKFGSISYSEVLYMAQGTPGDPNSFAGAPNAVFRCMNPQDDYSTHAVPIPLSTLGAGYNSDYPVWYVGDGNLLNNSFGPNYDKGGSKEYPTNISTPTFLNSTIKIAGFTHQIIHPVGPTRVAPEGVPYLYAANTDPLTGALLNIQVSIDGGQTWNAIKNEPTNYLGFQGEYDSTIATPDGNTLFVGGQVDNTGGNFVMESPDAGATASWKDISVDSVGNGPHTDVHTSTTVVTGSGSNVQLYVGSDGGIWKWDNNKRTWSDLNGNLATITFNSIDVNPNNPDNIIGGSQDNGTEITNGNLAWTQVDGGDGGRVRFDPNDPSVVYDNHFDGNLAKSTTGGTPGSFNQVLPASAQYGGLYFNFVVDPTTSRVLVAPTGSSDNLSLQFTGYNLNESFDQGATWTDIGQNIETTFNPTLNINNPLLFSVNQVAIAQYQGPFVSDNNFKQVFDKGANSYDGDTIYVDITKGIFNPLIGKLVPLSEAIFVTKDHGTSWADVTPAGFPQISPFGSSLGFATIQDMQVDPRNRDTCYLIANVFGSPKLLKTTDAGHTWNDITGSLQSDRGTELPAWHLVIDPRTGSLYLGTDEGVYTSDGDGNWSRFGIGLPHAQVTDLTLDQTRNILTVATYGRSVYQVTLNGTQTNDGALTSIAGSGVWNGPIQLEGATYIGAGPTSVGGNGFQPLQAGYTPAQLTILGTIGDDSTLVNPGADTLTKVGLNNVILSGTDTYAGLTDVQQGGLIVNNPKALGGTTNGTIVEDGAALQLETSVFGESLTLAGNGPVLPGTAYGFNGHQTGALENLSNNNTWSGNVTLTSNVVTIGVDTGSTLNISGNIGNNTTANPYFNSDIIKELPGILILSGANAFGGNTAPVVVPTFAVPTDPGNRPWAFGTVVVEGALSVASNLALGAPGNTTTVLDGAQLEMQGGVTVPSTQNLRLSGTGINVTGAIENVGGVNEFDGPISLAKDAGFFPTTTPGNTVALGALFTGLGDSLTLTNKISPAVANMGLSKVGLGTVVLNDSKSVSGNNNYTGATTVVAGTLRAQTGGVLGTVATGTTVDTGAALELDGDPQAAGALSLAEPLTLFGTGAGTVQTVTVTGSSGTFNLKFNGATSAALPFNATAVQVASALNALSTIGGLSPLAGFVTVLASVSGGSTVYSILFGGGLGQGDQPLLQATTNGSLTVVPAVVRHGNAGALRNVTGSNNTTTGTITLQTDAANGVTGATIGVDANTSLTTQGVIGDPAPAPSPAAVLTKSGQGTLIFPTTTVNTYTGLTDVQNGILRIQNAGSLGSVVSEVQTVLLTGPSTGTFTLSFNGVSTAALAGNASAAQVQAALNNLSTIGGVGGWVTVTKAGSLFTITFAGSLAGHHVPKLGFTGSGGTTPIVTITRDGSQGTVVESGATLQMQAAGTFTVSSEALTLNGPGFDPGSGPLGALDSSGVDSRWNQPITLGSNASFGAETGDQLTLPQSIGDGGSAFGVTKVGPGTVTYSVAGNNTYTGLTQVNQSTLQLRAGSASEIQGILINGGVPGTDTFTLTFNGQTTSPALKVGATQAQVQAALQSLTTIGAGNVTVDPPTATANGTLYTIHFAAALANSDQNQITVSAPSGGITGTFAFTTVNGTTIGTAVAGDLTIGDGALPAALALWQASNQVADSASVIVNSDGTLNLNGQTETLGKVTINDGTVTTNAGGTLTIGLGTPATTVLTMTGGTLSASTLASQVILQGNVSATSDATSSALMTGAGQISLGGTTRTFGVPDGPQNADLLVNVVLSGGSEGLVKLGAGRLELDAANSYGGPTTISQGVVNMGPAGSIANVYLDGGTLSGNGTVGKVTDATGSGGAIGTIDPGNNTVGALFGILNAQDQTWGPATTFQVDLTHASLVSPFVGVPGVDNDQLVVSGNVNLNGAVLLGNIDPTVQIGDQFTILKTTTGQINGHFQELYDPGVVFIQGQKFTVTYTNPVNNPLLPVTEVILTRSLQKAVVTITPVSTSAFYGQDVTWNVKVTPEPGASPIPASDSITAQLDGFPTSTVTLVGGQASFDAFTLAGKVLDVGAHTLNVTFNGDATFATSTSTASLQVIQAFTSIGLALTDPATTPVTGQKLTVTATVAAVAPGAGIPTGTVTFTVDGGAPIVEPVDTTTGKATLTLDKGLPADLHRVDATYSGDTNFKTIATTSDFLVVVAKDNVNFTLSNPPSPTTYGQAAVFTAHVSAALPGQGTPTGTVKFFEGTTFLGSSPVDASGNATLSISTLVATTPHTITANYLGDSNFNVANSSTTYTVGRDNTATSVTADANPAVNGQTVTFTAKVIPATSPIGTPGGTVTFLVGGAPQKTVALVAGQASFTETKLPLGSYDVTAQYNDDNNFAPSLSPDYIESVGQASTSTVIIQAPSTTVYGQPIVVSAQVSVTAPGSGAPTGTVQFNVDGSPVGTPVTLNASEQVTTTLPTTLGVGTHNITATYNGATAFSSSTSAGVSETINKASTSTGLTESLGSTAFGQAVTFTATVQALAPGAGTPTGSVTFTFDNKTTQDATLNGSGVAQVTLSTLPAGTHVVSATYDSDKNFFSSTSASVSEVVNQALTSTTLTSSGSPSALGSPVIFTATVTAVAPGAGTPTGTVIFTVDGHDQPGVGLDNNGKATLTLSTLTTGDHTVIANYGGDPNFVKSLSPTLTQKVMNGTTVSLDESTGTSVFGQMVTFTATVSPVAPATGVPGGTVTFTIDGKDHLPPAAVDTTGKASLSLTNLPLGNHTIFATYSGDTSFESSVSPTRSETVSQASTTTGLTSTINPAVTGQSVTFTATVTVTSPGAGTPTGSVLFSIDGQDQLPAVPISSSGQATLTAPSLAKGQHTVIATYSGDSNFSGSASPALTQGVYNDTAIVLTEDSTNSTSVFGQPVTFTAAVSAKAGTSGIPTGTVTFTVDNQPQTSSVDPTGKATLTVSNLGLGLHTITAKYNGDNNFIPVAAAQPVTDQVVQDGTTTAVTSSSNPSLVGTSVIFTATVAPVKPGTGIPTGKVTFNVDGSDQTAQSLDASGKTTLTLSNLTPGAHTITASYGGDVDYSSSVSSFFLQRVGEASSTNLTLSPDTTVFGQPVIFTATVLAVPPAPDKPSGSVVFTVDGTDQLPAVSVDSSGQAKLMLQGLGVGPHSVFATYTSSGNFNPSTSPTLTETVKQAGTATQLTSTGSPTGAGQLVTFTATVTSVAPGQGTPVGTVTFTVDGTTKTTIGLNTAGQAFLSVSTLTKGGHTVVASYDGSTNFAGSTSSPITQQVIAASSVGLTASSDTTAYGQAVTFTATVTAAPPATGQPTGAVNFLVDGKSYATASINSFGVATLVAKTLPAGPHTITATYAGDSVFAGSSSLTINHSINKVGTTAVITSSASPASVGQQVTLITTITPANAGAGQATGTVSYSLDGLPFAKVNVSGGKASLILRNLGVGTHTVTASYSGSSNFAASTAPAFSQAVLKGSRVQLTQSLVAADYGQPATFTALVRAASPATGTPAGKVQFYVDGKAFGKAVTLNKGKAVLALNNRLNVGTHQVKAVYGGSTTFFRSSSLTLGETIIRDGTTTTLTAFPPGNLAAGDSVTLTAAVHAQAPGSGLPTGSVTFTVDGSPAGTIALVNGKASLTLKSLGGGRHAITAQYNSDKHFFGSVSPVLAIAVGTTVDHLSAVATPGQNGSVSVTVTAEDAGGNTVTGYNGATATLSIDQGPAGGTLSGTTQVKFSRGQAFFDVSLSVFGTYRLKITTPDGLSTTVMLTGGGRQGG